MRGRERQMRWGGGGADETGGGGGGIGGRSREEKPPPHRHGHRVLVSMRIKAKIAPDTPPSQPPGCPRQHQAPGAPLVTASIHMYANRRAAGKFH